jgi:sensor histidine kinase regulating citrate/malate metabolism
MMTIDISDSGHGFEDSGPSNVLKEELIGKGRGFGLFLTHEIVKNLGGHMEIASEKMVGTVVKINIPVEQC